MQCYAKRLFDLAVESIQYTAKDLAENTRGLIIV